MFPFALRDNKLILANANAEAYLVYILDVCSRDSVGSDNLLKLLKIGYRTFYIFGCLSI